MQTHRYQAVAGLAAAPRERRAPVVRRPVHGVLLLDKPFGVTSNDALQRAKRLFRAEKAGHTGTLDPLATGVLPLCFGAATKFSQAGLDADKTYRATLRLGLATTTGDAEGAVRLERPVDDMTAERIAAACRAFVGAIDQTPPMHSALKHEGRALYDYARAGIEVERPPRQVTIHAVDVADWRQPFLAFDVRCSKGTYIRTLAEDLGEALGCGAHLAALRRTASGTLSLDRAVTFERLDALSEGDRDRLLLPVDALLDDWPVVRLCDALDAERFLSGQRRRTGAADASRVRVYGLADGAFLGSGQVRAGELIATRLMSPDDIRDVTRNAETSDSEASPTPPFN